MTTALPHKRTPPKGTVVVFVAFGVLLIVGGLSIASRAPSMQLATSTIDGEQTLHEQAVRDALSSIVYDRSLPFLFSPANVYLLRERRIETLLRARFPRAREIEVAIDRGARSIAITLVERKGTFLWCGDGEQALVSRLGCQFADERGVVFDDAPVFDGYPYTRVFRMGAVPVLFGQPVLSGAELIQKQEIESEMRSFTSFPIASIVFDADSQIRVYIAATEDPATYPVFKLYADDTLLDQLANLSLVKSTPLWQERVTSLADLIYVDARFDNRIIYKPLVPYVKQTITTAPIE
jgi:hypothetical protein